MATTDVAVEGLRRVCVACCEYSDRLIHGIYCVGCYNRRQEVIRGRNGKGNRPMLSAVLHTRRMAVSSKGSVGIQHCDLVRGPVEMLLTLAKRAAGSMTFGRPGFVGLSLLPRQSDLFGTSWMPALAPVHRGGHVVIRAMRRAAAAISMWIQGDLFVPA